MIAFNVFTGDTIQFEGDFLKAAIDFVADQIPGIDRIDPINIGSGWHPEIGVVDVLSGDVAVCVGIPHPNENIACFEKNNVWSDGEMVIGVLVIGSQALIYFSEPCFA